MPKIPESKWRQIAEEAQADAIRFRQDRDEARSIADQCRKEAMEAIQTASFARTATSFARTHQAETQARCDRYERALKAIAASTLTGVDFGDWVQCVCEDVLDGGEAECPECGTCVHEGPCVSADPAEVATHA